MRQSTRTAILWLAMLVLGQACECGGDRVSQRLADLLIEPDPVDFGAVPVSTTSSRQVTLSNGGTAALQLVELQLEQNPEDFSLRLPEGITLPLSLAPGNHLVVEALYHPQHYPEQDSGSILVHSTDSKSELYHLACLGQAVEPVLLVQPVPVDFGAVRVGATAPATLAVSNTGSSGQEVEITAIELEDDAGGDFAIQQAPVLPARLPVGEQLLVNLSYTPQQIDDADNGLLVLHSDAPSQERLPVALQGSSFAPVIEVEPSSLDFGLVQLGEHPQLGFTISNQGNHELQILSMGLSQTGSQQFELNPSRISSPIAPLAEVQVMVTYRAEHRGSDDGAVMITHDDPLQPTRFVQLHGRTPAPDIDLQPDNLTIRLADQAHSQTVEIRIYNVGDADLTVTGVDFDNPDGTFSLDNPPTGPETVAPGSIPDGPYLALQVTFETYQQTAGDTCALTIYSDDPDEPSVVATLIGTYTP